MTEVYGLNFYKNRHSRTVFSAEKILSVLLKNLPKIESGVDFGCGVGTWLSVLKNKGAMDVLGLDGMWVNRDLLEISKNEFKQVDFEAPITLTKKYDLAISLEVAEHISQNNAEQFVNSLAMASDFILFSAAILLQGGTNHINEQWQSYWCELFSKKGYKCFDFIRNEIWHEKKIPVSYRQNVLFYAKESLIDKLELFEKITKDMVSLNVVHPESYLAKTDQMYSVRGSFKLLRKAVKKAFK